MIRLENKMERGLKQDESGGNDETPVNVKFVPERQKLFLYQDVLFHFVANIQYI